MLRITILCLSLHVGFTTSLHAGKRTSYFPKVPDAGETYRGGSKAQKMLYQGIVEKKSELVTQALNSGAGINDTFPGDGYRPVTLAAAKDCAACLEILLDRGAIFDVADKSGWYPIHHAVYRSGIKALEVMHKRKLLDLAVQANGYSALELIGKFDKVLVLEKLVHLGIVIDPASEFLQLEFQKLIALVEQSNKPRMRPLLHLLGGGAPEDLDSMQVDQEVQNRFAVLDGMED